MGRPYTQSCVCYDKDVVVVGDAEEYASVSEELLSNLIVKPKRLRGKRYLIFLTVSHHKIDSTMLLTKWRTIKLTQVGEYPLFLTQKTKTNQCFLFQIEKYWNQKK